MQSVYSLLAKKCVLLIMTPLLVFMRMERGYDGYDRRIGMASMLSLFLLFCYKGNSKPM